MSGLRKLVYLSLLPVLLCASGSSADEEAAPAALELPIQRIVLFDTGVGFFEHRGVADGDAAVALEFDVEDIKDLLKSMVVQDEGGGTISAVSYAARDQRSAFGIDLSGEPTRAELLQQLRGERVHVEGLSNFDGTIVGLELRSRVVDGVLMADHEFLNLLTDKGLQSIALDSVDQISLADEQLQGELLLALRGLTATRRADKRPVTLRFSGQGTRQVRVGYLRQTPVWKTSYRLVLGSEPGQALLQAWAIVENTGESDWSDVRLTLVSGRPVSFVMDLYEPLFVRRPVVKPPVAGSPKPRIDAPTVRELPEGRPGGMGMGMGGGFFGGMGGAVAPDARQPADDLEDAAWDPSRGVLAQATGADVGELFQYELDVPLTLERRQAAMVPIINDPIEAKKLSVFTAGVDQSQPMHALRITNLGDQHLTAGPIAVFEDAVYAGDAQITLVRPGEERLIRYALDQGVSIASVQTPSPPQIASAEIADGELTVYREQQQTHEYRVANRAGTSRHVLIEHPQPTKEWKVIQPEEPAEKTETHLRYELTVPAGTSQQLQVVHQRDTTEAFVMADLQVAAIREYLREPNVPDPVKQTLRELAEELDRVHDLRTKLTAQQSRIRIIEAEQKRIKGNMRDLDYTNELYQRYLKMLETTEDELATTSDVIHSTEQELAEVKGRIEVIAPRGKDPFGN